MMVVEYENLQDGEAVIDIPPFKLNEDGIGELISEQVANQTGINEF